MKKIIIVLATLCMGAVSAFGQGKAPAPAKDTVLFDKSFEDAGEPPSEKYGYHLAPKFYKAGDLAPEQPIALSAAKEEAKELVRARPTPLRRDCLNVIYTVDPIYSEGTITGAVKGTIVVKWDGRKRVWVLSYLKYQLINVETNACVFKPEME
jgi:hypothetical protein